MIKFLGNVFALLTGCALTACTMAPFADAMTIPIHELRARSAQLIGKSVTTHGCLSSDIHGGFIEPCGSEDWKELTPAYERDGVIREELRKMDPKRVWARYEVEGTFTGTFVAIDISGSGEPKVFFEVTSFDSLQMHEP